MTFLFHSPRSFSTKGVDYSRLLSMSVTGVRFSLLLLRQIKGEEAPRGMFFSERGLGRRSFLCVRTSSCISGLCISGRGGLAHLTRFNVSFPTTDGARSASPLERDSIGQPQANRHNDDSYQPSAPNVSSYYIVRTNPHVCAANVPAAPSGQDRGPAVVFVTGKDPLHEAEWV